MADDGFFSASVARAVRPKSLGVARCDECGLYAAGCRSPKMPRGGAGRKRVLVVVDNPDRDADATGVWLVGRDGQALDRALAGVGIDLRDDCFVTGATRCHARSGSLTPLARTVDSCRPLVLKDVAETDPTLILLFGVAAVRSVVGHLWGNNDPGVITRWAGQTVPAHKPNAWVCPMYGPGDLADAVRGGDTFTADEFRRHLGAAAKLVGTRPWPAGPPDYRAMVEVVADPDEAARRLARYTGGLIAYDFETNMLKPDKESGAIACASVCWEGRETIAFPWHGAAIPAMKRLLTDSNVGKIMQNCTMEIRWTRRKLGVAPINVVFDTMLAAHALCPREKQKERGGGVTGLKFLAFARLGCPDYSQHLNAMLNGGNGGYMENKVRDIDPYQLMTYCAMDSLLEFKLAEKLAAELRVPL